MSIDFSEVNKMTALQVENIEASVLGYLIANDSSKSIMLNENDFKSKMNRRIFSEIKKTYDSGEETDIFELINKTGTTEEYIDNLVNSIPMLFNFDQQIKMLKEQSVRRKLYSMGVFLQDQVKAGKDVYELKAYAEKYLESLQGSVSEVPYESIGEAYLKMYEEREQKKNVVFSGLRDLDFATDGFFGGNLVIIAGRPSMGKTTFALNIATNMAKKKQPVAFFSFEMTSEQLRNKVVSRFSSLNYKKIKNVYKEPLAEEEKKKLNNLGNFILEMPLILGKTTNVEMKYFKEQIRKLVKEKGLKALFIDYLQLMVRSRDKVAETGEIAREFKLLALELNIPIFLLSQLSRNVESRENKRPNMSDLRDSGNIEEHADIILFLYREAYYKREEIKPDKAEITDVIIAKNRDGETINVSCAFYGPYCVFFDLKEG